MMRWCVSLSLSLSLSLPPNPYTCLGQAEDSPKDSLAKPNQTITYNQRESGRANPSLSFYESEDRQSTGYYPAIRRLTMLYFQFVALCNEMFEAQARADPLRSLCAT